MTTADLHFYGRMLGSPIPATFTAQQAQAWVGAALKNPEKRAAAHARMDMLIASLPTPEDAARTPTDPERPTIKDTLSSVYANNGTVLGGFRNGWYEGLCPCESGSGFRACHGAA